LLRLRASATVGGQHNLKGLLMAKQLKKLTRLEKIALARVQRSPGKPICAVMRAKLAARGLIQENQK